MKQTSREIYLPYETDWDMEFIEDMGYNILSSKDIGGKTYACVDKVWYNENISDEDVRNSLISHDGYPDNIHIFHPGDYGTTLKSIFDIGYCPACGTELQAHNLSHRDNGNIGIVKCGACKIKSSINIDTEADED